MASRATWAEVSSGAYGFRLVGSLLPSSLLVDCPRSWPSIEVMRGNDRQGDADLVFELGSVGTIALHREASQARFQTPELSGEELIHPYLAPVAGTFALWRSLMAFHGGAVVVNGQSWAVLGDRWDGKSSLLSQLAVMGHPVLSDDVLITNGTLVYAGPRCLDLRQDVAEALSLGRPLRAGLRERWRLDLPPVEPELPIAGWFLLTWGDRLETRRLPASRRLASLVEHHLGLPVKSSRPEALLGMSAFPAWQLSRPRTIDSLEASAQRLLALVS